MNFAKHVKIRNEKFGAVIFDTLREKVFVTNETGKDILQLLMDGRPQDEMIEILSSQYQGMSQDITHEISDFVDSLRTNNILV